jgi:hypothetical protein
MAEKDNMAKNFDNLQNKITTLFRPIFDPIDEFFIKLIGEFQKAGVDFLEINNFKKTAIAKHSNYYEYPERRYAIVVNENNKVKFYELEFKSNDIDKNAKEVAQQEFEQMTIPTYLKPNPLQTKEDSEEDKKPTQPDEEGTKEKKDKDALSQVTPEEKKLLNFGDTSSPKVKESKERVNEELDEMAMTRKHYIKIAAILKGMPNSESKQALVDEFSAMFSQDNPKFQTDKFKSASLDEVAPEGWEGTVKAMKKHKGIDNPWALAHSMKNKGFKSHIKDEGLQPSFSTVSKIADEKQADATVKDFDDKFEDKGSIFYFKDEAIVGKYEPEKQMVTLYKGKAKAEATERPIVNATDTVGYTGTVGNVGPLEGTQYKVAFKNREDKDEKIIVEAEDVKEAAKKVYGFGAKSIVSADKINEK